MKQLTKIKPLLFLAFGLGVLIGCEDERTPLRDPSLEPIGTAQINYEATADSMQVATYNTFLGSNNTFVENNEGSNAFHYWPNAHALDVLVDAYLRSKDPNYVAKMRALFDGIKIKNGGTYENVFNDDMLWLGLSSLRAYQATGDADYRLVATELWESIQLSWSDVFGGGIAWKKDTPYSKNAVSNAPAVILVMELYKLDPKPEYLQWAQKIYAWQKEHLIEASTGLVWDNVALVNGVQTTNKDWVFTYNMGTWIGAGLRLHAATGELTYLQDAVKTGQALISHGKLVDNGLLRDEGQGDGGLFKGIGVRYLTELIGKTELNSSDQSAMLQFLGYNAKTFYEKGIARPKMMSGSNWAVAPTGKTDLTTQLSGLMLLEAAAKLQKQDLIP
ncbi:glycoside hydrolase family 76 protein [Chryseobacterium sp. A301]